MRTRRLLKISVVLVLVLVAGAAPASDWPSKPVRFVIPAAPGGTTDGLARIFSARLTETLNTQFIVDNRASASGVLAAETMPGSSNRIAFEWPLAYRPRSNGFVFDSEKTL